MVLLTLISSGVYTFAIADTPSNSSKKSKNSAKGRTAHSKNLSRTELRPDCLNSESDGDETLGLSEDAKWIRRHFKKPLAIALRCMLIHRPRDPVDYLGKWLLNYQKIQEQMRIRENFICELMEQRRIIKENDFVSFLFFIIIFNSRFLLK